jgi:hypothetical protein
MGKPYLAEEIWYVEWPKYVEHCEFPLLGGMKSTRGDMKHKKRGFVAHISSLTLCECFESTEEIRHDASTFKVPCLWTMR